MKDHCEQGLGAGEEVQGAVPAAYGLGSPSEICVVLPKRNEKPLKGCKPKSDPRKCRLKWIPPEAMADGSYR